MDTSLIGPDVVYEATVEEMIGPEDPVLEEVDTMPLAANPRARTRWEAASTHNVDQLRVRTALLVSDRLGGRFRIRELLDIPREMRLVAMLDHEVIIVVGLREDEVIFVHEASIGGIAGAAVEARQVVKLALLTSSPRIVVIHNHPSGNPSPSGEDHAMTRDLLKYAKCVDVEVDEHFVIARNGITSIIHPGEHDW